VKSLVNYLPGNKDLVKLAAPRAPIMAPIIRPVLFWKQKKSARAALNRSGSSRIRPRRVFTLQLQRMNVCSGI
jgi:hypothetical protein